MEDLTTGINYYKQKRYKEALNFFLSISNKDSEDAASSSELAYYLGLCHARLSQYEDALEYLEQVVLDENMPKERILQCTFILAVIYAKSNRTNLANYELKKLMEAEYNIPNVYAAMAYISYENMDFDKCTQYYERALELDNENSTALNGLGYVLCESGVNLSKALSYCKKASELSPSSATFDSLGWVYHQLGMDEEAKTYLSKALMLCPTNDTRTKQVIKSHLKALDNENSKE